MVHLDTSFLILGLSRAGRERAALLDLAASATDIRMSAIAWYEFSRGPRTPEQMAAARALFPKSGVVPFSEQLAEQSATVFRQLGSPRKRAADVAIGVSAAAFGAQLFTCNHKHFAGIPNLNIAEF